MLNDDKLCAPSDRDISKTNTEDSKLSESTKNLEKSDFNEE